MQVQLTKLFVKPTPAMCEGDTFTETMSFTCFEDALHHQEVINRRTRVLPYIIINVVPLNS